MKHGFEEKSENRISHVAKIIGAEYRQSVFLYSFYKSALEFIHARLFLAKNLATHRLKKRKNGKMESRIKESQELSTRDDV